MGTDISWKLGSKLEGSFVVPASSSSLSCIFLCFIFSLSLHVDGLIVIASQKSLSGKWLKCFLQLFVFCQRNRNSKLACIFFFNGQSNFG